MLVTLKDVRLAYADIWEPRPPKDGKGEPKYGATFILDPKKNKEAIAEIRATIKKVAKERWKEKGDRILKVIEGDNQKYCYFEEDMLNEDGDPVDGFEGMYYIRCKSTVQPTLIDRDRTELFKRDGRPYSGCRVVAKIDIWAQDNTHGKGLRCQVQGIQFFKDGDAFGGGVKAKADSFEDLSDLGDDDDDDAPPARRSRAQDDDDAPARKPAAKRRAPVDEDEDEIA